MRLATYTIPAAPGDGAPAECAVFYFGPGQGGDPAANVERWISQFENPQLGSRSSGPVHGIPVTRVEVTGTYLAPSGPRMESQDRLAGAMLLGAIAEGPSGNVFFKLTGPQRTVRAARDEFAAMVGSLRAR